MRRTLNNVYEMHILVRPGPGSGMPDSAVGGDALCFVGAPDHETALRLAFEELNSRGFLCEDLIGRSVGQIVPQKWHERSQDIRRELESRFCDMGATGLPTATDIRKLIRDGGFYLGPFFCWESDPEETGPGLSDRDVRRHDELFTTGYELAKDLIFRDSPLSSADAPARGRLRKAIKRFDEALAIIPTNWSALLLRGKALQMLGEHEEALTTLERAHECDPTQIMVAVELGAAAGRVGRHDVGVRVMEAAAREHPDDPRLPFNLGLSYLFLQDFAAARAAFQRAIELEPEREANQRLLELLNEVQSGMRPCPKSEAEIATALS
jgi:tetratricopeptide (TPR) repeat protein